MDDAVWNHAVFSKNRDRLLTSDVAQRFFAEVNKQARKFMSDEHFTVDGTLIQAWASQKSFRSKDGSDGPFGFTAASSGVCAARAAAIVEMTSIKHAPDCGCGFEEELLAL